MSVNSKLRRYNNFLFWVFYKNNRLIGSQNNTSAAEPPRCLIRHCKFQQLGPIVNSDVPPLAGAPPDRSAPRHDQSPTPTFWAHNHKSLPRKHTPTTSLHKNIPQHHRGKLLPNKPLFLSWEQQGIKLLCARIPLFFRLKAPPAIICEVATSAGTGALVYDRKIFVVTTAGYILQRAERWLFTASLQGLKLDDDLNWIYKIRIAGI